jgi:1-acyl-sn-glycerol-3-phosphate acyltransferase
MTILYVIVATILYFPYLIFLGKQNGIEVTGRIKRRFGIFVMRLIDCDVEVCYEDYEDYKEVENSPFVVISNHQSFVDIPLLLGYFPKSIGFVAKKEIRNWLIFNFWMDRAQCVFLDRKNPKRALSSMKEAMKSIKNGNSIVIFPEGTRSSDGEVGEFKKGSFKLATSTKVPIIPVSIDGTFDVMNKNRFYIKKGYKVRIVVGRSYITADMCKEDLKEIHNEIRNKIISNMKTENKGLVGNLQI